MAITWGAGDGSGYGIFYVGIDYSISGTSVTVRYYVRTEANSVNDTQKLTFYGKISGSKSFTMNTPNMGAQLVHTASFTGSRGSSYTVSASLSGTYSGGTPSHSRTITIPAVEPSKPGTPSVSSITSNGAKVTWSAPTNNGGSSIKRYQVSFSESSSFSNDDRAYTTSRSYTSTSRAPNKTYWVRVRAENGVGWSGWSGSRSFKTKPSTPSAPSSVSVSRTNDTRQVISWNRNNTSGAPYDNLYVERWDSVTNSYSVRATLSGSASSYTDTGTVANRRYRYRVRAKNSSGYSSYGYSNYISTTPLPPTNVKATKSGGNIVLTWSIPEDTGGDGPGNGIEIWHATDGVWDGTALAVLNTMATTYTHLSVNNAVTHTYRLKTRATKDTPNLYSAYSSPSNTVQLLAPPLAPTVISPADGSVYADDGSGETVVTWQHNPVDTTDQTKFEVQWRANEDVEWQTSGEIESTESSYIIPDLSHEQTWVWRVRTWGEYADPSPFNVASTFTVSSPPTVDWVSPVDEDIINLASVTAEWLYSDPDGTAQTGWEVELWQDDQRLEHQSGDDDSTLVPMETQLQNEVQYELRVRVRDEAPLWSDWVSVFFTTDFLKPAGATIIGNYNRDDGSMGITINNQVVVGAPDTVYNEVWVSEDPSLHTLYEAWEEAVINAGPTITYTWLGTANMSPSVETIDGLVTRTNVLLRPQPDGVGGWATSDETRYVSSFDEGAGPEGHPALIVERTTESPSNIIADIYAIGSTDTSISVEHLTEVLPDTQYTASVYLKSGLAAWRSWMYIYWYDGTGTLISNPETGWVDQEGSDWTRVSMTETSPAGAAYARLRVFVGTTGGNIIGGETVWVADAQLEEGPEVTPFFTGDSINQATEEVQNARQALEAAWRSTARLLATDLDLNTTITYDLPRLGVNSYYRVITASDLPSYNEGAIVPLMAGPTHGWMFLNGGPDFTQSVRLRAELKIGRTQSREKTYNRYKGRPKPIPTVGEGITHQISVSAKIRPTNRPEPSSSADDVVELSLQPGNVYMRDPLGHKWLVSIDQVEPEVYGLYEAVSFSAQEVEG